MTGPSYNSRRLCASALLILLAPLAGCSAAHDRSDTTAKPPAVAVTAARVATLHPQVHLAGVVAPYQNVAIQSNLTEPADEVLVNEGDQVHAGQLLIALNTDDLTATYNADIANVKAAAANAVHTRSTGGLTITQSSESLRAARAAVTQAQSTLALDELTLARDQQLLAQGYVAQSIVDTASTAVRNDQAAVRTAQSNLASAQAAVTANGSFTSQDGIQATSIEQARAQVAVASSQAKAVLVQIQKARITSPVDGVIVNRNINPGEYPNSRQILTIQQIDPVYAILHATTDDIVHMQVGSQATVSLAGNATQRFSGTVAGILNQVTPGSTDFQVKVLLQNPAEILRPGFGVVGIIAQQPVSGITIPVSAFTDDEHTHVYTIDTKNTVALTAVTEHGSDGTKSVVSGLNSGTRVISNGQSPVQVGEKVSAS